MAARLVFLAVLVCDCSALLLGASTPRHSMAQDTVARRSATVQMDLSSLVCDNPLAAIVVSSTAGTALGVLVSRALPTASMVWWPPSFFKKEPSLEELLVCPHPCRPVVFDSHVHLTHRLSSYERPLRMHDPRLPHESPSASQCRIFALLEPTICAAPPQPCPSHPFHP